MKRTQYGDYATWVTFEVMANYQVRIIFSENLMKSAKARGVYSTSDNFDNADAFVSHLKNTGMSYMFLPLDITEHGVAHEAWHVVYRMMHYINVNDLDDEIIAYHLDHLVEKIYRFKNKIQKPEVLNDPRTGIEKSSKSRNRRR